MRRPEIVQYLIDAGANLEDKTNVGVNAVKTAISWGDKVSLKLLIAAGADFTSGDVGMDLDTNCPMVHAARSGRPGCLRVLIEAGADPLIESMEGSILYLVSTFSDQLTNCRILLKKGADPNKQYPDKPMTFIRAFQTDNKELVELFLDQGAISDSFDEWDDASFRTPLTHAAGYHSYDIMKLLLDRGASPNYCPNGIDPPLQVATWIGQQDTRRAELLLERGADIHWKRSDGWTPLQTAYDAPAFVSLFLKHGADAERQTNSGTVLMMAARWGYIETLKTLVAHEDPRPNLDTKYDYEENSFLGKTALDFAVLNGNFDCANFLLESGATITFDPAADGVLETSIFLEAIVHDHQIDEMAKFVKTCLDRGWKPDALDNDKNTFLRHIKSTTPAAAMQVLIDVGVPFDSPNVAGLTPLAMAAYSSNVHAVKLLLSKYADATLSGPTFGNLLFLACQNVDLPAEDVIAVMKLLIEAKADPHTVGPDYTCPPLLSAAMTVGCTRIGTLLG
ncbi:hypothetical protein ACHAPU_002340 [Fusarium lateritium]